MRSAVILLVIIALANCADPEACLQEKCPNEYSACKKEVFGCAAIGLKCKQKCGADDAECQLECARASGNAKLIALSECGAEKCKDVKECDTLTCSKLFTEQCLHSVGLNSRICVHEFLNAHPECECDY